MGKIYKVALVGCGNIFRNHISKLLTMANVEIKAICDIDLTKAENAAKNYGLNVNIYESYDKMLLSEELDSVHIMTPHYLHCEMTLAALERDLFVFLEKPIAITTEEASLIIEKERKSRGRVCVCFQNRFNRTTVKVKELIEEDGGVTAAFASVVWQRDDKYYLDSKWRGKFKTEGGGVLINQAIHTLDLLCYLIGKPSAVIANCSNRYHKDSIEVEDTAEGTIEFESSRANFYCTTTYLANDRTEIVFQTKNHEITILGDKLYLDKREVPLEEEIHVGKECYGGGHAYIIEEFYNSIDLNKRMPVTPLDAQYALAVLLSAYRSKGERITL